MNDTKILVTGATGTVGRHVVTQLVTAGAEVRALTRAPEATWFPEGVEVVHGDQFDPSVLEQHLEGVRAVFLVWPDLSDVDTARDTVRVIAEHASRVVFLSSAAVRDDVAEQENVIGYAHAEIERAIERSGVGWTFLRPYAFASNTRQWAPAIRAGETVRIAFSDVPVTLIDERDIAAVAVRSLTEHGHDGQRYLLSGPELLTPVQQLRIIGDALGRELSWDEMSPEEWARRLLGDNTTDEQVTSFRRTYEHMRSNPGPITSTVQRITGRPARTFREWVGDHGDDLAGPLPMVRRDDAGVVLISTWALPDEARQRAAADAAMDAWEQAPWPDGLLSHSVLLGTDSRTVLHYSQWSGVDAVDAFQRTDTPSRIQGIDEAVPGIRRSGVTRYRLYHSVVPDQLPTPGVIVLVSFETDSAETGRRFVDELLEWQAHAAARGDTPTGGGSNHFHVALDGSGVINYAEFPDERTHDRVLETRLRSGDDVPNLIGSTSGLTALGFARYVPYRMAVAR